MARLTVLGSEQLQCQLLELDAGEAPSHKVRQGLPVDTGVRRGQRSVDRILEAERVHARHARLWGRARCHACALEELYRWWRW